MTDTPFPQTGRLCGVDYGTVRVGIAITDMDQSIASPFETYTRRTEKLDEQYFRDLIKQELIKGIVVGLPVHHSGDPSQKSNEAANFGKWLHELTGVPVIYYDERFSTAMARELVADAELSGKRKKSMLDRIAAQVILTAYLESPDRAISDPLRQFLESDDDRKFK